MFGWLGWFARKNTKPKGGTSTAVAEDAVTVTIRVEHAKVVGFIGAPRATRRRIERSMGELVIRQMLGEFTAAMKARSGAVPQADGDSGV